MDTATNAIFECINLGDFASGWELYQSLEHPTPQDQRWAGACLQGLQKPNEAKQLLLKAVGQGYVEANIQLAAIYRMSNETEEAQETLARLEGIELSNLDKCFLEREYGIIHYQNGNLAQANKFLKLALDLSFGNPESETIQASITYMLGIVLSARGYASQAKSYFSQATLNTPVSRQTYALANRGLCHTYLGEFNEAQNDMQTALKNVPLVPIIEPVLQFYLGQLSRARGEFSDALKKYLKSIELSELVGEPETEFYAQLGASAIFTHQEAFADARKHLARAKLLAFGDKMRAYLELREGAMLVRLGQPKGTKLLESALESFETLQLEREAGWVRLHLTEAHLRSNHDATALTFLDSATDARNALGIGAAMTLELRCLPFTLEIVLAQKTGEYSFSLLEDWQTLSAIPTRLQIRSLGKLALFCNDTKIKINAGLATTIEVIAYLIKHPNCTLEQVVSNVFSEKSPEAAKRYFHLIRTEVKQNMGGCSIPFNENTRTYHFEMGEIELQWDFNEVARGISQGNVNGLKRALEWYKGEFLTSSENEWVLEERSMLEWNITRFGLSILEESFEKRDFETCLICAEQLLVLNPENEAIIDYFINATFEVKGPKVGRRELERLKKRFLSEFGDIPEILEKLSLKYLKAS